MLLISNLAQLVQKLFNRKYEEDSDRRCPTPHPITGRVVRLSEPPDPVLLFEALKSQLPTPPPTPPPTPETISAAVSTPPFEGYSFDPEDLIDHSEDDELLYAEPFQPPAPMSSQTSLDLFPGDELVYSGTTYGSDVDSRRASMDSLAGVWR